MGTFPDVDVVCASQVCSQQEPLSNWSVQVCGRFRLQWLGQRRDWSGGRYVVRSNDEDRKSCGSVRLQFAWTEASKEYSKVRIVVSDTLASSPNVKLTRCRRR
eukprot:786064-Rhodomonas_salina.4